MGGNEPGRGRSRHDAASLNVGSAAGCWGVPRRSTSIQAFPRCCPGREGTSVKGSAEPLRVSRQIHSSLPEDRPHIVCKTHIHARSPVRVRGDGHRVALVGGTGTESRAVALQPGGEDLAVTRACGSRREPCPESAKPGSLASATPRQRLAGVAATRGSTKEGTTMPVVRVGAPTVCVTLSLVGASTAGAQTPCAAPACSLPTANCLVNASSLVDGPGCCASACKTIEGALSQVPAGAVIKVAAGTYDNVALTPLTINKTVTLCGAQFGVDARTPRGPDESIIAKQFGTTVSASNGILDGVQCEGVIHVNPVGFGLDMGQGTEGTQVYNSIFQNNIAGIALANTGRVRC